LERLVSDARRGDRGAEEALVERLLPFLRRRVAGARRRRNWFWLSDPEDLVQDVLTQFVQAVRDGRFEYAGERALEGYLVRTAWFGAMNLKDKHRPQRSLHDPEEGGERFDLAAFAEAIHEQVDRRDCLRLLAEAVAELNANRRDVVERTLLGQKVRDISAATGRTAASVSGLKFNALVELRRRLEERGFLERCGALFALASDEEGS